MAIWADANISGLFAYRDWTKSSLPFVDKDEIYWSRFTFQKLKDAKIFVDEYGGKGNWMEEYEEFIIYCDNKRN